MIKATLSDLFSFLRNPKDEDHPNQSLSFVLGNFFILFVFEMAIMVLLMGIIALIEEAGLLDMNQHAVGDMIENFTTVQLLVVAAIIFPFVEEFIFRFFLKYKRNVVFLLVEALSTREESLEFWNKSYKVFFYMAALAFGYMHIFNFGSISLTILALSPILVMPQIIMGSIAGYLRVRFGFVWAFLLHALHNFLIMGLSLLAINTAIETLNTSNENYDIKIEEIALSNDRSNSITDSENVTSGNSNSSSTTTQNGNSTSRGGSSGGSSSSSYGGNSTSNTSTYSRKYTITNYNTKDLYAHLLGVDKGIIEVNHESIKSMKFNIELVEKKKDLDKKQIILDEMEKAYDVEVLKEDKNEPSWKLIISDTSLLMKHMVQDSLLQYFSSDVKSKQKIFKSHKIKQLTIWLNNKYADKISSDITLDDKFDFSIPLTRRFKIAKDSLLINYGLDMEREDNFIDHYIIKEKDDTAENE